MNRERIELRSAADLQRRIAGVSAGLVTFDGDLHAGKTTLARATAHALDCLALDLDDYSPLPSGITLTPRATNHLFPPRPRRCSCHDTAICVCGSNPGDLRSITIASRMANSFPWKSTRRTENISGKSGSKAAPFRRSDPIWTGAASILARCSRIWADWPSILSGDTPCWKTKRTRLRHQRPSDSVWPTTGPDIRLRIVGSRNTFWIRIKSRSGALIIAIRSAERRAIGITGV